MLQEKSIFKIIIFVPILFVFFVSSIISYFFIKNDYKYLNTELKEIEIRYIDAQKEFIKNEINTVFDYIEYKKALTEEILKKNIKTRTMEAYNIAIKIYERYKDTKTKDEITTIIKDILREIRFNNSRGYYFGLDYDGVAVLFSDRPHLEGINMMDIKSINGAKPIEDIVRIAREKNSGFYEYLWSKPKASGTNHRKIAFVKLIEPLEWVVGTGEYFDDVESDIKNDILNRIENIRYGKNGYIFIIDLNGKVLVHPFLEVGSNVLELKDSNNFQFTKEFVKISKTESQGYVEYFLGTEKNNKYIDKKISFIKYQKEWNWMIGTGVYYGEIKGELEKKKISFQERIELYKNYLILFSVIAGVIITILSILFGKMINKIVKHYRASVKEKERELLELNKSLEQRVEIETEKRREKEQLLIQQSKMAQMGEMINSIAHQWRQPLNVLALKIQDVPDTYEYGELNEKYLDEFVQSSMNQINFMSSTIDDFRNFFKPNKSKEKFNIFKIVDEVLNVLSFDLRYKNIKVTKVGDNFSLYLFKNEFKQVLLNLLNNAKDEILKRGQNYIGEVDIKCYMKDNKKIIIIEDNAGGVPKEIINRIFEPYFTTKEQTQGTGIGLYMSKMIIEKNMNGTLDVSNTERGAKFSIIFDIGMED